MQRPHKAVPQAEKSPAQPSKWRAGRQHESAASGMRNAKRGDFPSMDMLENLASSEGFVIGVKNGGFFRSLKPCILIQGHLRPPPTFRLEAATQIWSRVLGKLEDLKWNIRWFSLEVIRWNVHFKEVAECSSGRNLKRCGFE
jgi:hypothetical protein